MVEATLPFLPGAGIFHLPSHKQTAPSLPPSSFNVQTIPLQWRRGNHLARESVITSWLYLCSSLLLRVQRLMLQQSEVTQVVVIMVGLPARGKSLIAGKGNSFQYIKAFQ